ncbi:AzlD domain-containing protein [Salinisphaera sp. USBA-960]|uniref:AzlD domain-containing protein n=1 Tax=Salinisphaera orenii TaxID=856731 RepID=UPI0013A60E66|nr:AzlD domain-containing protein [Salifodinibacter halophilus]NNC25926.1 AzlD domain-containing protein [Salifodinibacter halophilus]
MNYATLFIAIAAIAIVTGFCRVIPFLLPRKSRLLTLLSSDQPSIKIVALALQVGLTIATLVQPMLQSPSWPTLAPYSIGGLVTVDVFYWSRSVGLTIIVGVLTFGLADYA